MYSNATYGIVHGNTYATTGSMAWSSAPKGVFRNYTGTASTNFVAASPTLNTGTITSSSAPTIALNYLTIGTAITFSASATIPGGVSNFTVTFTIPTSEPSMIFQDLLLIIHIEYIQPKW